LSQYYSINELMLPHILHQGSIQIIAHLSRSGGAHEMVPLDGILTLTGVQPHDLLPRKHKQKCERGYIHNFIVCNSACSKRRI